MFEHWSYVGYTLLCCVPPLILLWLRREFFEILRPRLRGIALATIALTVYGSAIWPIALRWRAWAYRDDRITGVEILGYVWLDDVLWWALVGFLMASFVALSTESVSKNCSHSCSVGEGGRPSPTTAATRGLPLLGA